MVFTAIVAWLDHECAESRQRSFELRELGARRIETRRFAG